MSAQRNGAPRYLVAHPGAELYGSDRVMLESVIAFVEDGADVTVTLPENGPLVDLLVSAGATVRIEPALVLRKSLLHPRNWAASIGTAARAARASWRLVRELRPDAVYVSTMTLPLWPPLARLLGVPSLLHLHEGEATASRPIKWAIYSPARFARRVVVNSEFSRGVLGDAFPSVARCALTVYNGVAGPDESTTAPAELDDEVRLVYIGRLSPRKGPDLIVRALAQVDDPRVTVELIGAVFRGYEGYEQELRGLIEQHGLSERVRLLGFRPDVWSALDAAHIIVVPSRVDEPFGNTAVEGTLARRVVLVSDTSGLREAVAGVDTAISFAPDDVDALAEAIRSAIQRWPELAPRLTSEADAAASRFSRDGYRRTIASAMAQITPR